MMIQGAAGTRTGNRWDETRQGGRSSRLLLRSRINVELCSMDVYYIIAINQQWYLKDTHKTRMMRGCPEPNVFLGHPPPHPTKTLMN